MTKKLDPRSPFNWRLNKEPTIFAKDLHFRPRSNGKSNSELQSQAITRRVAKGENPGTVPGLSSKKRVETMLAYKQFGVFSRAEPTPKKPNKHEQ